MVLDLVVAQGPAPDRDVVDDAVRELERREADRDDEREVEVVVLRLLPSGSGGRSCSLRAPAGSSS